MTGPNLSSRTHFKTTQKYNVQYSPHKITEYVSSRTGMRVVVVDQQGPKVQGFFAAATEILDDSGSPHTLEHLCFMGSKSYPYKGLLDKLATRGYSNTNAWTATDHTAYTLETAGYAAFAQILPVYLEHVILPTLTDAGCYTEVFHVDGTGHDAGVVYSEMQGVQNTQSELMELRGKRLMYPEGIGFRYETGGMMEQLRDLTAERIRRFHREMYQPKNLCLVIVGGADHNDLLSTLDRFEESILPDIPKPDAPFRRPWVDSPQPPPLKKSDVEVVEFPEEDESVGEIVIRYFGPSCNEHVQLTALTVLLSYLAGSSASLLENTLVEKEQLASAVYYHNTPRPKSVIEFTLSGVDATKLSEIEARFHEVLQEAAKSELDMSYLTDCLNREKRQDLFYAENSDSYFTSSIISTFLFSETRDLEFISDHGRYDEVGRWSEQQWRTFMKEWITEACYITTLGKPSSALSKKLKEDEETRVADQIKRLGDSGLKELDKKLQQAKNQNDREIPREILERFKVPSTDTIQFISTIPARAGTAKDLGTFDNKIQQLVDGDKSSSSLFIHFEHIPSNFIDINILISTSNIPVVLRPMLAIYMENLFNSPVNINGSRMEFEQVVKELEKDTIDFKMVSASDMGNGQMLSLEMAVESTKYETAVNWIKDLLWNGIFDVERIKSTTVKLLMDVPEEKRSGSSMAYSASTMVNESPESISRARDTLVKALYLKRVQRLLETEPQVVLAQLEDLKKVICDVSSFRVLVIADIEKLRKPTSTWELLHQDTTKPLAPLDERIDRLSPGGKNPGDLAYIIPMSTIDSSFAVSVAKGPESPRDPRVPALLVTISYLDAVEGPLWTAVRGTGLAYGHSFRRRPGHIEYSVYRSPDAYKAFAASKKVVEDFISGETQFDTLALEGAVSSIVLNIASDQATMSAAAEDNFVKQVVRDLPRDWNDLLLEKVRNVTVEEIKKVMEDLLLPAFQPATSNLFVTGAPIMEESLMKGFNEMGYKPEVKPLMFFQDDYGLKVGDGEDGNDDEDDDMSEGEDGSEGESANGESD